MGSMAFGWLSSKPKYRSYYEKLRDPKWLAKRDSILADRGERCEMCGKQEKLEVHHGYYRPGGIDPWNYESHTLWCLCRGCHNDVQAKLTAIHKRIGEIHPKDLPALAGKLSDVAFEVQYGMTPQEVEEILAEERKIDATLYRDYRIDLQFSNEHSPSRVDDVVAMAEERFPGIEINTIEDRSSRDCVPTVHGPDREVRARILSWADKQTS